MNRREFVKMSPAFAAASMSASLVLREDGKEPVELDVSVLKVREGDTLVLTTPMAIPSEMMENIRRYVEHHFQPIGIKAMVMSEGLRLDGVLRRE